MMAWNLSAWSIHNPVPTTVLFILLSIVGIIAFGQLLIALGIGVGAETRSPMAIAVVGGLLTLVLIPVVFTFIDNFQEWIKQLSKLPVLGPQQSVEVANEFRQPAQQD